MSLDPKESNDTVASHTETAKTQVGPVEVIESKHDVFGNLVDAKEDELVDVNKGQRTVILPEKKITELEPEYTSGIILDGVNPVIVPEKSK